MAERDLDRGPLRVGLIAPPWVPVPPPVYGGTELVLDLLARGLVELGHDVVLAASGDSTCPVPRVATVSESLGTTLQAAPELASVERAHRELGDRHLDVIHDHTQLGPLVAGALAGEVPVVTTVHNGSAPWLAAVYRAAAPRVTVLAISHDQRRRLTGVPVRRVIHHGVDVSGPPGPGDGGYLAFLGRMHPDKGPDRAIRIARSAGWPLVLAAKAWEPVERRFFGEVVAPMLGPDAVFVGELGPDAKRELLAGAAALVSPLGWPEPFGLAMVEAMVVGTPVLATRAGSAPELVDDGVTGWCVDGDDRELAGRVADVVRLDRSRCRQVAIARFAAARMVDEHVELYRELRRDAAATRTRRPPAG